MLVAIVRKSIALQSLSGLGAVRHLIPPRPWPGRQESRLLRTGTQWLSGICRIFNSSGIDSISLNPDSVVATLKRVAEEMERIV
jgi:hypothetical protein